MKRRRDWLSIANDSSWAVLIAAGVHWAMTGGTRPLVAGAVVLLGTHIITGNIKARRVIREARADVNEKKETES